MVRPGDETLGSAIEGLVPDPWRARGGLSRLLNQVEAQARGMARERDDGRTLLGHRWRISETGTLQKVGVWTPNWTEHDFVGDLWSSIDHNSGRPDVSALVSADGQAMMVCAERPAYRYYLLQVFGVTSGQTAFPNDMQPYGIPALSPVTQDLWCVNGESQIVRVPYADVSVRQKLRR